MPQFLAGAPGRCERLRAEIGQATDTIALASLWPAKVRPLLEEASDTLAAAGTHGTTLLSVPGKLATLVGEADSALLLSGQQAGELALASLGPATGLARLARGQTDRDTLARRYGHRGSHEMELTVTNIGWTPVFPRAAAVVTDVGAPLSHAAIVARELGIPAVVGCGNATMLLHTGDRVRVDGSHGTVEVLLRA